MSPSPVAPPPRASRSLDSILSELVSALRGVLVKSRGTRYALIAVLAAIAGSLAEWKRRDHNRDEAKRRIPHRRNSAVHLYDGMYPLPREHC